MLILQGAGQHQVGGAVAVGEGLDVDDDLFAYVDPVLSLLAIENDAMKAVAGQVQGLLGQVAAEI